MTRDTRKHVAKQLERTAKRLRRFIVGDPRILSVLLLKAAAELRRAA